VPDALVITLPVVRIERGDPAPRKRQRARKAANVVAFRSRLELELEEVLERVDRAIEGDGPDAA
jgi:hypothetical protein